MIPQGRDAGFDHPQPPCNLASLSCIYSSGTLRKKVRAIRAAIQAAYNRFQNQSKGGISTMFNTIRFNDVQQTLDHLRRSVARLLPALLVSFCLLVDGTAAKDLKSMDSGRALSRIEREVRHELVMLPFYGVFDNLSFRVNGDTVT